MISPSGGLICLKVSFSPNKMRAVAVPFRHMCCYINVKERTVNPFHVERLSVMQSRSSLIPRAYQTFFSLSRPTLSRHIVNHRSHYIRGGVKSGRLKENTSMMNKLCARNIRREFNFIDGRLNVKLPCLFPSSL